MVDVLFITDSLAPNTRATHGLTFVARSSLIGKKKSCGGISKNRHDRRRKILGRGYTFGMRFGLEIKLLCALMTSLMVSHAGGSRQTK